MDVDVGSNPKKRSAAFDLEEVPFAKRTKYKELFPSAFTTVCFPIILICSHVMAKYACEGRKRLWNSGRISTAISDLASPLFA